VLTTGGLCLRGNRESSCLQGFSSAEVRGKPSRPRVRGRSLSYVATVQGTGSLLVVVPAGRADEEE